MRRFVELAERAAEDLAKRFGEAPSAGVILGSGFRVFGRRWESVPYSAIPGFPVPKAGHHRGVVHLVERGGRKLLVLEGRAHLYDGYSAMEATLPIAAMVLWGIESVVTTGLCGAIGAHWVQGQWVEIRDCMNLSGDSPDWPHLRLRVKHRGWCGASDIPTVTAAGILGPSLPTRAEWAVLAALGADVVSMSVTPERSACLQLGLKFRCIYLVTDVWDGRRFLGSVAEARSLAQRESSWLWDVCLKDLG